MLLVVGAALVASLPLLRPGLPDTHDGLFHYYRLAALHEAVRSGCLYPRWFPDFAFGYGQPVLLFYGPGSYYIAELFCLLGVGYLTATKLSMLCAGLVAGTGAYGLARIHLRSWPSSLVATAYVLAPYRLADLYVRGAFAEVWGLALLPLLLVATERVVAAQSRRGFIALVSVWTGLVLTHNLTALMAAPLWLVYVLIVCRRHRRSPLLPALSGAAALGLSAFYWLPIVEATPLVGLGNTFSTDAWERYLTAPAETLSRSLLYHYFPDQGVAHQYPVGLAALVGMALAVALVAVAWRAVTSKGHWWFAVGLAGLAWMLQCSAAAPVWRYLPLLGFLQFPWRLMGPFWLGWALILGTGLDAGISLKPASGRLSGVLASAGAVGLAVVGMVALPRATVAVDDGADWTTEMWRHDAAIGQVGATWTAEYVPVWVTVDRSAMPRDPVATDRPPGYTLPTGTTVAPESAGYYEVTYRVSTAVPLRLALHRFYFPGWSATVDGQPTAVEPHTDLGLMSLVVPAGEHRVRVSFVERPLWTIGRAVSALTAAALAVVALLCMHQVVRRRAAGGGWAAVVRPALAAVVVGGASWLLLGCRGAPRPVAGLWAPFEDVLALTGWVGSGGPVRAGTPLTLSLHWLALATPKEDYKVFVHLVAPDGRVVAQSDGDPVGGYTPTRRLVGGEVLVEERTLTVPVDAVAGQYELFVGLYRWPEVTNLTVTAGEHTGEQRVAIGTVEVTR